MIIIKKITFNEICEVWKKYLPNMSLEPNSAMNCMKQLILDENHQYIQTDTYDLENQKFTPTFWGAFDNEKLIGVNSGHMTLDRMYRSRGLYVNKDYRGRGIGQKLLMKTTSQGYHENAIAIWSYPKHDSWSTYGYVGFRQSGHTFNFEWEQSGESFNTKSVVVLDEEALYQLDTPQHQTP
tara:strand:- start:146 stop:688 length:543 start_codon:yes stop_codon:yes gene_type:complete